MFYVLECVGQGGHDRGRIRCGAILSALLSILRASERRLNRDDVSCHLDRDDWAFQFEVMIAPLWSSVMNVDSSEDLTQLTFRVFRASSIIRACRPLLRSYWVTLGFDNPYGDE